MSHPESIFDLLISQKDREEGLRLLDLNGKDINSITATNNRFGDLLEKFNEYSRSSNPNGNIQPSDHNAPGHKLRHLRDEYQLESIAGTGTEINQLCNLMHWVHGLVIHTSNPAIPRGLDSLQLLNLIENNRVRINCGMFATILHEVYLSMGWKSKIIHFKPYQTDYLESHVGIAVFSDQLKKWLFFDPNLNACFMDEKEEILSIPEIRQRFIAGDDLLVSNSLTFKSENKVFAALGKYFGEDFYKFYISKNIFRYSCSCIRGMDMKSEITRSVSIELIPLRYGIELAHQENLNIFSRQIIYTTDADDFWQPPQIQ